MSDRTNKLRDKDWQKVTNNYDYAAVIWNHDYCFPWVRFIGTFGENIIGSPKLRNNYGAI